MLEINKKYYFFSAALVLILCGSVFAQLKAVTVKFSNQTKYPVDVFWVNEAGGVYSQKLYNTLKPQTEYVQPTYQTHKWSIRYQNSVIGEYVANDADNQSVAIVSVAKEAGPIWNQTDAQNKCRNLSRDGGLWTGAWWTTVKGKMSVCEFILMRKPVTITFSNHTKYDVHIYQLGDGGAGSEKLITTLKSTSTYNLQTFQTHRWRILFREKVFAEYVANDADNQYVNILLEERVIGDWIRNQKEADKKCPRLARGDSIWTGVWWFRGLGYCEFIRVRN
jgi:hypothetical protein